MSNYASHLYGKISIYMRTNIIKYQNEIRQVAT